MHPTPLNNAVFAVRPSTAILFIKRKTESADQGNMKWLFGLLGAHYCLPPSCKLLQVVVLNQDYPCQLGLGLGLGPHASYLWPSSWTAMAWLRLLCLFLCGRLVAASRGRPCALLACTGLEFGFWGLASDNAGRFCIWIFLFAVCMLEHLR